MTATFSISRERVTSLTLQTVAGLVLGLLIGLWILQTSPAAGPTIVAAAESVVRAWTNAFRLIVAPLVVCQLVLAVGAGGPGAREFGRLGAATPIVFGVLLLFTAAVSGAAASLMMGLPLLDGLTLPYSAPSQAAAASASAGRHWVDGIIPPNLVVAAASDNILALIVFATGFGIALRHVAADARETLVKGFTALNAAVFMLVKWLIYITPAVVFALAVTSGSRAGLRIGGAMLAFVGIEIAAVFIVLAALYVLLFLAGGVAPGALVRAFLPAQLTAMTTRSSLATIPALLAGSGALRIPAAVSAYVIPLGGGVLKISRALSGAVKFVFLVHLLNIPVSLEQVVVFITTILVLSPSTVGMPSISSTGRSLPAYVAAGIPAEYYVLLAPLTGLTDMFLTLLNTSGYAAATVLVARFARPRATVTGPAPVTEGPATTTAG